MGDTNVFRNFLQNCKIVKVKDVTADGTTAVTSDIVDTANYRGVVFFTSFGTAAADNTLKVQQGAAANMSDAADLLGSSVSAGTSDEDVIAEVHRPQERYCRCVLARGTTTTVGDIWAILYGAITPQLSGNSVSGTQIAELSVSPIEGTA